jgi:hypothetical protein
MSKIEIWKDIPEYEGLYQVSSFGNVKSLDRVVIRQVRDRKDMFINGRKKKPAICKSSRYYRLALYKNSKGKNYRVHQLVAMAFLGHKPNMYEVVVDHIDGNRLNNNLDNLRLVSPWENNKSTLYEQKYIGITYHKRAKRWYIRGLSGSFLNQDEAKKYKDIYEKENN